MSFIRKKKSKSGKVYAYEVTSTWNPKKKQSRSKSTYLGVVDEGGNILPKGSRAKPLRRNPKLRKKEKAIKDCGDSYLISEYIKNSSLYKPLKDVFEAHPELLALMTYRLCNPGPMNMGSAWLEGTILKSLSPKLDLSSQRISKLLKVLGDEGLQKEFFEAYLAQENMGDKNIIIDATSLENQSKSSFSAWGYGDGSIEKQFRFHCVIDQKSQKPLFYRLLPGNIPDVATLENTLRELNALGVKSSFALLDAGFCSEGNIQSLYKKDIDFLMRLPASRRIFKDAIREHSKSLESLENIVAYGKRSLFAKTVKTDLYGSSGYVYLILDPSKKAKDINKLAIERSLPENATELNLEQDEFTFAKAGIFMLISSKKIPVAELLPAYYMRQSVEQVFSFAKSDLDMLPIRCHSDENIKGYLFLVFLLLIIFVALRKDLAKEYTVEKALLLARQLKCKIFDEKILAQEPTKHIKNIFKLCNLLVPTF